MMRMTIQRLVLVGLLCCVLGGCAAERRREVRQKAMDLKTHVELLQQRVDAQERRLEKLENQVFEMGRRQ